MKSLFFCLYLVSFYCFSAIAQVLDVQQCPFKVERKILSHIPQFGESPAALKNYLNPVLKEISLPEGKKLALLLTISSDGTPCLHKIQGLESRDIVYDQLVQIINQMPKWTPGGVLGKSYTAQTRIDLIQINGALKYTSIPSNAFCED